MKAKKAAVLTVVAALALLVAAQSVTPASAGGEKPIVVCTTNVLGSLVGELVGEEADIVVLVHPGLCPADYDMKPSDIYAVSKAKILFYHDIPGEKGWLPDLIEAAGNQNLTQVRVLGVYNTPEGAKQCINLVGGNLSEALSIDLGAKMAAMLADVDEAAAWMASEAQALNVSTVKVVCMKWQEDFVKSVGFEVVATYNPPETLSAGNITSLVETARREGVALIIDNLQVGAEFAAGLAPDVGAVPVVLTNFPGAVPGTGNLTQMFRYNARQLFDGVRTWRNTRALRAEMERQRNRLTIFQAATSAAVIIAAAEAVWIYAGRRRR